MGIVLPPGWLRRSSAESLRRAPRVQTSSFARVYHGRENQPCLVRDWSVYGARFMAHTAAPVGERLSVELHHEQGCVELEARVARVTTLEFAAEFTDHLKAARELIPILNARLGRLAGCNSTTATVERHTPVLWTLWPRRERAFGRRLHEGRLVDMDSGGLSVHHRGPRPPLGCDIVVILDYEDGGASALRVPGRVTRVHTGCFAIQCERLNDRDRRHLASLRALRGAGPNSSRFHVRERRLPGTLIRA